MYICTLYDECTMKKIVFVPEGGLANRMRGICAALQLSDVVGSVAEIIWFRSWGLNATFRSLFLPIKQIREAGLSDHFTNDRPTKKNLFLPSLYQKFAYDKIMIGSEIEANMKEGFDFESWAKGNNVYICSYLRFYPCEDSMYAKIFVPKRDLSDAIGKRTLAFSEYTIGMHIRRADHILSIKESPTCLFHDIIHKELCEHDNLKIYFATDSEEVKREFKDKYGDIIITSPFRADRDSQEGIKEGVIEMFALSKTRKIYGSFNSSFSIMASKLGGIPLTMVKQKEAKGSGITF